MGESIRSTVKNAARLAVYELIMISVKNHHMPATIRVETALWWRDVLVAFRYVWFGERREERALANALFTLFLTVRKRGKINVLNFEV